MDEMPPEGWIRKRDEINEERYQEIVAASEIHAGQTEMRGKILDFIPISEKACKIIPKKSINY